MNELTFFINQKIARIILPDCGCSLLQKTDGQDGVFELHYCPTHNAAPDLLEACKAVQSWWDSIYPDDIFTGISGDPGTIEVVRIRNLVRAATAKATEEQ